MARFAKGDSVIYVENNAKGVIVDVFSNITVWHGVLKVINTINKNAVA